MAKKGTQQPPGSLADDLQADLIRKFQAMPGVLEARLKQQEGSIDVVDASVATLDELVFVLLNHLTRVAEEVDRLRAELNAQAKPDAH
jgi:hypothetical protein